MHTSPFLLSLSYIQKSRKVFPCEYHEKIELIFFVLWKGKCVMIFQGKSKFILKEVLPPLQARNWVPTSPRSQNKFLHETLCRTMNLWSMLSLRLKFSVLVFPFPYTFNFSHVCIRPHLDSSYNNIFFEVKEMRKNILLLFYICILKLIFRISTFGTEK